MGKTLRGVIFAIKEKVPTNRPYFEGPSTPKTGFLFFMNLSWQFTLICTPNSTLCAWFSGDGLNHIRVASGTKTKEYTLYSKVCQTCNIFWVGLLTIQPRHKMRAIMVQSRNLKGGIGSLLTRATLWDGGHIDYHVWSWVIVPSDLARSVGAICACYRYRVIHCGITCMRVWLSPRGKGNSR